MDEPGHFTQPDRRWAMRRSIELDADLTDAAGVPCAVKVTNISEEGCMVRMLSGREPERHLLHEIKITGLEPLGAYVIWSKEGRAGLAFSTPLHPMTVRSLVTKSLYARLSRRVARTGQANDEFPALPPFPFDD